MNRITQYVLSCEKYVEVLMWSVDTVQVSRRTTAGGEKLHTRESTELHSSIVGLGAPAKLKGTTTNEGTGLSHVKHSCRFLLPHGKMLPKNQHLEAPTASAIWKFRRKASVEMICPCAVPVSSALLIPAMVRIKVIT